MLNTKSCISIFCLTAQLGLMPLMAVADNEVEGTPSEPADSMVVEPPMTEPASAEEVAEPTKDELPAALSCPILRANPKVSESSSSPNTSSSNTSSSNLGESSSCPNISVAALNVHQYPEPGTTEFLPEKEIHSEISPTMVSQSIINLSEQSLLEPEQSLLQPEQSPQEHEQPSSQAEQSSPPELKSIGEAKQDLSQPKEESPPIVGHVLLPYTPRRLYPASMAR